MHSLSKSGHSWIYDLLYARLAKSKQATTNPHTRLNRSKLLAITSFTKLGKQEIDLIEIESDSDQEAEANKEKAPENINIASQQFEKDESLKTDESVLKTTEKTTNPEVDPNQEVTSKIAEEIVEESLSENLSEDLRLQRSDRNDQLEEQQKDPQIVPVSVSVPDLNLTEPELKNEQFSQADFEKSKNSKTAAMFQRHGKLLEDNKSSSNSNKKDEKSKRKNIFSCCLCCKKEN